MLNKVIQQIYISQKISMDKAVSLLLSAEKEYHQLLCRGEEERASKVLIEHFSISDIAPNQVFM